MIRPRPFVHLPPSQAHQVDRQTRFWFAQRHCYCPSRLLLFLPIPPFVPLLAPSANSPAGPATRRSHLLVSDSEILNLTALLGIYQHRFCLCLGPSKVALFIQVVPWSFLQFDCCWTWAMSFLIQGLSAAGEVLWFVTCASHADQSAPKCVHRFPFSFSTSAVIVARWVASIVRFGPPSCFEIA